MFKPMLADTIKDINTLTYPLLASTKLDGIRAVVLNGKLVSRNLKEIPNKHVQAMFGKEKFNDLDGELIYGDPTNKDVYRNTMHVVMTEGMDEETSSKVTFYVFDWFGSTTLEFKKRYDQLRCFTSNQSNIVTVEQKSILTPDDLTAYEEKCLEDGYEGVMVRDPFGKYKFGRSTLKEGTLLKLKRFCDSEAKIIRFEERLHNGNKAVRNALGNLERSSHQANKTGMDTLGALQVVDVKTGVSFDIGTGFNDELRAEIWNHQAKYKNMLVKYKYFPSGSKDKPRFPVFLGFRDLGDL